MQKKYSSTPTEHILEKGVHRVAIERLDKKRITKADKEILDKMLGEIVEFRDSEFGHRSNRYGTQ